MKKKLQLMSKKYNHEEHYAQLQVNKLNNQEELNKFLETYDLLSQEEIESLNRPITSKETESVIKSKNTKFRTRWLH